MFWILMLFLFFLYLVISPFLPKGEANPTVIHNTIHIVNNPSFQNHETQKQAEEPKLFEDNLFGRSTTRF